MLRNKGNTMPYYDEYSSGCTTNLTFINRYSHTMQCHSIFILKYLKLIIQNIFEVLLLIYYF